MVVSLLPVLLASNVGVVSIHGFVPVPSSSSQHLHRKTGRKRHRLQVIEAATLMEKHMVPPPAVQELGIDMPRGLAQSLAVNAQVFHKHIWIVDNSGSMTMYDGHYAVDCEVTDCTRWAEVQETVNCHAQLAEVLGAPTDFKLLNPLRKHGGSQTFRVGYGRGGAFFNPLARRRGLPTQRMESALAKSKPAGMTPLPKSIHQVRQEIEGMVPQLIAEGTKVCLVIATDGSNYNKENLDWLMSEEERNQELVQALESLQGLPVSVVIRLCTDYEPLVDFYKSLDTMDWNLDVDVLDDHKAEAMEVQAHQPWLNYALLLHRMREMGHYHPLLDLLDERPLTPPEIRDFLRLLFGQQHFQEPYQNTETWAINLLQELLEIQESEQTQSCYWKNPLTNLKEPWINIEQLAYTLLDDNEENEEYVGDGLAP